MSQPNLLVLIIDAARAANFSSYGYERTTTPILDQFAHQNIRFANAFAPATWTVPTHTSMLTGLYLSQHRIESVLANRRLHADIVPLPTALSQNGYVTGAFSQNVLFGPTHHFDYFDHYVGSDDVPTGWLAGYLLKREGSAEKVGRYTRKLGSMRNMLTQLVNWTTAQEKPYFAVCNLANAHYPWAVPPDLLLRFAGSDAPLASQGQYNTLNPYGVNSGAVDVTDKQRQMWRHMYDASLAHVDREIGRFFTQLQQQPGWQNTIVVVTADHGELIGDYQHIVGHMLCLSNKLLHVPLIVRHPDHVSARVSQTVVQTHDLFHSMLQWSGTQQAMPAAQLQRPTWEAALAAENGSSLAFAEEDYTDSYTVPDGLHSANADFDKASVPSWQRSVQDGRYKLVARADTTPQLFDLQADPHENDDLLAHVSPAANVQATQQSLQKALDSWYQGLKLFPPQQFSAENLDDPVLRSQLQALGYVP